MTQLANSIQSIVKQNIIPFQGIDGSNIVKIVKKHFDIPSEDIIHATEIVLKNLQNNS